MKIGNLIKQYRKENKITLRDFAKICGTSHSYIAMLENDKNSKTGEPIVPSLTMLSKLSQGMGMTLNELINICDDMPVSLAPESNLNLQLFAEKNSPDLELTEGERMLVDLFRQIPAEQQKRFLEMGRLFADSLKTN